MRYLLSLTFIFIYANPLFAQSLNWSEDIASIIFNKCTSCHHQGGVAPFALTSYQEVTARASIISHVINHGEMPPWPPDDNFSQFTHNRDLTQQEVDDITIWINTGTALGDTALAPCPPTFGEGTFLGTPDLKLTIPYYKSKATAFSDDYVCFALPTNLATDRYVEAVEVVPGNPEIVHHVIMYVDPNGTYPTDTVGGDCMGPSSTGVLGAYAPGSLPTIYPNGGGTSTLGVKVPAGSNIILAMHYPEGSAGELDSTSIHLFFYPQGTSSVREVSVAPVAFDLSFCIPPNQTYTLTDNNTIPFDLSVLSVFPHMHLLGSSIISYAITPQNDTIKLINIPHWDFEWQDFYYFKNLIKIPAGSTVFSKATYDNTTNNPHNPNFPPQTVCGGLNTTDEMFIVSLQVTPYISGDENISIEDLLSPPEPTISANGPTTLCSGDTVTLTANSGYSSYQWCPTGETTQSIEVTMPGAYYVEVTDAKGVSGNSNTIIAEECVSVTMQIKAFLGGPYNSGAGLMNDNLRTGGLIPLTEPYGSVFTHVNPGGGETIDTAILLATGDNAIVDWLFVELRDEDDSSTVLATRSALIQRDGDIVDIDGVSALSFEGLAHDNYFVVLRHRSHLGIMTANAYSLDTAIATIDFSSGGLTYGTDAQQGVNGKFVMWSGDVILDGIVKYSGLNNDRDQILLRIGGVVPTNVESGYYVEDVNCDGIVRYSGMDNDRDIILLNIGGAVPTNTVQEQLPD